MKRLVTTRRLCIEIFFASILGLGEIFLMGLSDAHPKDGYYEFVYPAFAGFLMGILARGQIWIVGPATMLCLPIGLVIDASTGGGGLNLWPIALLFYFILAVIGFIGALMGRGAKWCWMKWIASRNA